MEITDEIKIKVIAQYVGANCKVTNEKYIDGGYIGRILGVCTVRGLLIEHPMGSDADENIEDCKLILKPLSSLTKEDAIILNDMKNGNSEFKISYFEKDGEALSDGSYFKKTILDWTSFNFNQYQYLISQFYDIPHRLLKISERTKADLMDGKTLQEVGLAIYE